MKIASYIAVAMLMALNIVAWAWAFTQGVRLLAIIASENPDYAWPIFDQLWWFGIPPLMITVSLGWAGWLLWKGERMNALRAQLICLAGLFIYFLRIGQDFDGS